MAPGRAVQLPVLAVMRLESAWNGFSAGSGRTELRPHRRPAPRWRATAETPTRVKRATAGTPARTGVRLPARPRLGPGHLLGFDIDTEAVSYGGNLIGRPDFLEEEVLQPLRDVARRLQERLGYPILHPDLDGTDIRVSLSRDTNFCARMVFEGRAIAVF